MFTLLFCTFRCSVLAAANSVFGRWDDTKGEENIDFLPTILSRFDMIYVVKGKILKILKPFNTTL